MPHPSPFELAERLGRRAFLRHGLMGLTLATSAPGLLQLLAGCRQAEQSAQHAAHADFILRSSRPIDLETPVEAFLEFVTPAERFFVRSHHDAPAIDAATWRLELAGLVDKPLSLSLAELKAMEKVSVTAVLQCSGNGRARYSPHVPGVPWERGAVGNGRWAGVRLAELLKLAGVKAEGKFLTLTGVDQPLLPSTPRFIRSLPLAKGLHPDTILAYELNGEPLPLLHGFPLRLVAPGWVGDDWLKWLGSIRVEALEDPGFFFKVAYRMPNSPAHPGEKVDPARTSPLTLLLVKSLIASPAPGASLPLDQATLVQGVAWSGGGAKVAAVKVSVDGGQSWADAELFGPDEGPYAWRQWRHTATFSAAGPVRMLSRATDDQGHEQPLEASTWNPSGFLWNAADAIDLEVGA